MITTIIGFIASFTSIVSLIPQIIQSYRTRSVRDISLLMLINFCICSISWVFYGILTDAQSVWLTNIIMSLFSFILLYFKVKYND